MSQSGELGPQPSRQTREHDDVAKPAVSTPWKRFGRTSTPSIVHRGLVVSGRFETGGRLSGPKRGTVPNRPSTGGLDQRSLRPKPFLRRAVPLDCKPAQNT